MKPDQFSIPAPTPAALIRRAFRRGFSRNERGAVAVEFALLALPFFAIIGAILETAFFFLASQILDSAVDTSVRLLRTGQAQSVNLTASGFRANICDRLFNLFTCSELKIEVKTTTSFSAATFAAPLSWNATNPEATDWTIAEAYTPGEGSQYVTVRVYYKWPTILDLMGFNLANAGTGYRLMAAVRVFRNEPF